MNKIILSQSGVPLVVFAKKTRGRPSIVTRSIPPAPVVAHCSTGRVGVGGGEGGDGVGVGGAGRTPFSKQLGVRVASQQQLCVVQTFGSLKAWELQSMRVGLDASHPGGGGVGIGSGLAASQKASTSLIVQFDCRKSCCSCSPTQIPHSTWPLRFANPHNCASVVLH